MSISAKLHALKEFVVHEIEAIAGEAEKVFPAVEAGAKAVAAAVPVVAPVAAVVEKVDEVVGSVVGCCGCSVKQHDATGCTGCDKCPLTKAGARNAGAPEG